MKATIKTLALALSLAAMAPHALAKEGGDQSANGSEGFMAGALPPPGSYYINYLGHYDGRLQNQNGDAVQAPNGKELAVGATFNVMRFVHVTDKKILGADWGFQAILPVVQQNFDVFGAKSDASGVGDLVVTPVALGWHFSKNLHVLAAVDFFLPTGRWNGNSPAQQIGANYYSIEPLLGVTYLTDSGFEASAKLMYNIKASKNPETQYKSGDEFHMDYTLAQRTGPWAFGVGGYYLKQTTDDKVNGVKVGANGNRGEVFAIGPQVGFTGQDGSQFIVKWHHETEAENRFQGDKVWFKYIRAF